MRTVKITLTGFAFEPVAAEMSVSASTDDGYGTLVLRTGACNVQAYAKPEELRALAAALLVAADELEGVPA